MIIPDAVEDKDKSDVKPVLKLLNDLLVKNEQCKSLFVAMAKATFAVWKKRNPGGQELTAQQSIVRAVMKTRENTSAYFQIMLCFQDLCSFRIHVKDHLGFKGIVAKALNAAEVVREGGLKNLSKMRQFTLTLPLTCKKQTMAIKKIVLHQHSQRLLQLMYLQKELQS